MPRPDRTVIPSLPHHVTHRGNRRAEIFRDTEDYRIYLRLLRKAIGKYDVRLWGYTLMPNHVHLIAVPDRKESLSDAIQWAHGKYAELFNSLYDTVGHLWQGRFGSSVMDEHHVFNAMRYVERNPVRACLVSCAEDYRWSSAPAHCGLVRDPLLSDGIPFINEIEDWSSWLAGVESPEELRKLRESTQRGYPYGSDEFVSKVENLAGRKFPRRNSARTCGGDEGSDPSSPPLLPLW